MQAPLEVGRWRLAAALNAREAGSHEEAYRDLAMAMRWMPGRPILHLQRAEWLLADGKKDEALVEADKIIALQEEPPELMLHAQFLQRAGRKADAVADFKKIDAISQRSGLPPRFRALNALAYARAVASVDLEEALQNANEAVGLAEAEAEKAKKDPTKELKAAMWLSAVLDTRGYILYLKGRYESALADMNRAIELDEASNPAAERREDRNEREGGEIRRVAAEHLRRIWSSPEVLNQEGSEVFYEHRALILQALGNEQAAEADLARARELTGRDPAESLY
jgi:tetratricopeptide (TPR) repeat protein